MLLKLSHVILITLQHGQALDSNINSWLVSEMKIIIQITSTLLFSSDKIAQTNSRSTLGSGSDSKHSFSLSYSLNAIIVIVAQLRCYRNVRIFIVVAFVVDSYIK